MVMKNDVGKHNARSDCVRKLCTHECIASPIVCKKGTEKPHERKRISSSPIVPNAKASERLLRHKCKRKFVGLWTVFCIKISKLTPRDGQLSCLSTCFHYRAAAKGKLCCKMFLSSQVGAHFTLSPVLATWQRTGRC